MMSQVVILYLALACVCCFEISITAFVPASQQTRQLSRTSTTIGCRDGTTKSRPKAATTDDCHFRNLKENQISNERFKPLLAAGAQNNRRDWLLQSTRTFLGTAGAWIYGTMQSSATEIEQGTSALLTTPQTLQVEMKTFLDPMGLFVIQIPKRFFALRRSSQGDLPDAKGQGRRGSSIFTAGDLAKAEVIAIERFPIEGLLEENGIVVSSGGGADDLSTFGAIGKPSAVATLLNQHRERSRPGQSTAVVVPDSWSLSQDGKELEFMVKAEIEVQKPELLLEQYGVSRLFRVTVAKASLESNDGNVTAVFCSALEQDYQGPDGEALRAAAKSFRALDQSTTVTS